MELIQEKNSRTGVIGTILFHLLLLLLFIQFGMPYQDPPPENEGAMLINFGDAGGGSPSEENPSEESASSASSSETNETTNASTQENVQTTTNETVEMNASNNTNTSETEKTSDPLNEALSNAWNNNNINENDKNPNTTNGANNGNSNSNGNNTGPSDGIGFNLGGGRGKVSFKKPDNPTQEDGTVVVDIWVDKNGNVTEAKPGARGSTTTNPILYQKAKEAALKARFTKKEDAPEVQKGTMTFIFILN